MAGIATLVGLTLAASLGAIGWALATPSPTSSATARAATAAAHTAPASSAASPPAGVTASPSPPGADARPTVDPEGPAREPAHPRAVTTRTSGVVLQPLMRAAPAAVASADAQVYFRLFDDVLRVADAPLAYGAYVADRIARGESAPLRLIVESGGIADVTAALAAQWRFSPSTSEFRRHRLVVDSILQTARRAQEIMLATYSAPLAVTEGLQIEVEGQTLDAVLRLYEALNVAARGPEALPNPTQPAGG